MVKSVVKEGNENVCLADPITIYNNQFDDEDYKRVVETLIGKKNRTKTNNNDKSLLRPRVVIGNRIYYDFLVSNSHTLERSTYAFEKIIIYSFRRSSSGWKAFKSRQGIGNSQTTVMDWVRCLGIQRICRGRSRRNC